MKKALGIIAGVSVVAAICGAIAVCVNKKDEENIDDKVIHIK